MQRTREHRRRVWEGFLRKTCPELLPLSLVTDQFLRKDSLFLPYRNLSQGVQGGWGNSMNQGWRRFLAAHSQHMLPLHGPTGCWAPANVTAFRPVRRKRKSRMLPDRYTPHLCLVTSPCYSKEDWEMQKLLQASTSQLWSKVSISERGQSRDTGRGLPCLPPHVTLSNWTPRCYDLVLL